MRVILATGKPELDAFLSERVPGFEVVDTVHYREALGDVARRWEPEGAVVSTLLEGRMPIAEAIFPLRVRDIRVVVLCDRRPQKVSDPEMAEIAELLAMGVTDLLFSPVRAEDVVSRLQKPCTFGQAVRDLLKGVRPPSRKLGGLLGRLVERSEEAEGIPGAAPREKAPRPRALFREEQRPPEPARESANDGKDAPEEEDEEPLLGRTSRPSVGFWSPVGAGASTLALSSAYLLSRGQEVALLDLGQPPAQGALLCLPPGDFVQQALSTPPGEPAPVPKVGRVYVLPGKPGRQARPVDLPQLLSPGVLPGEYLVVDLPRSGPVLEAVARALWVVVVVGDPDWLHVDAVRSAVSYLRGRGVKALPVVNRHAVPAGAAGFQVADVFGEEPSAVVPCLAAEVYGAVATGVPVSKRCGEFAAALGPLVRALAEMEERENVR